MEGKVFDGVIWKNFSSFQNDEKRSPSNIGGTGEKMGSGDDEFSISPAGSLSIIP